MKYEIGQKIIGRGTGKRNKGEIKEYTIEKVGRKFIYIGMDSYGHTIPVYKDSLGNAENWHEMEFFASLQAMKDYDEVLHLRNELYQKNRPWGN